MRARRQKRLAEDERFLESVPKKNWVVVKLRCWEDEVDQKKKRKQQNTANNVKCEIFFKKNSGTGGGIKVIKKVTKFTDTIMTSPAATLTDLEATAINETSNIHYSRPATIFAAVAASIFTFVGITGNLQTVLALLTTF